MELVQCLKLKSKWGFGNTLEELLFFVKIYVDHPITRDNCPPTLFAGFSDGLSLLWRLVLETPCNLAALLTPKCSSFTAFLVLRFHF